MTTKKNNLNFPSSKKNEFIKTLMSMTNVEMNQFIKKNGKAPKITNPFTKVR